jgi:hypothetical protein
LLIITDNIIIIIIIIIKDTEGSHEPNLVTLNRGNLVAVVPGKQRKKPSSYMA